MKAPIQIWRADVASYIRALSALMKVSISDALAEAVRVKLAEEKAKLEAARLKKRKRVRQLLEEFWRLPTVGPMLIDADLYDEVGLPKSL